MGRPVAFECGPSRRFESHGVWVRGANTRTNGDPGGPQVCECGLERRARAAQLWITRTRPTRLGHHRRMTRRQPLPLVLRDAPMSAKHARELGVSASRLRASDLEVPFRGVRMPAPSVPGPLRRARALATVLTNQQFFSHQTAALIWGMPLPLALQQDPTVHVSAFRPDLPPRRIGVVGHYLKPGTATTGEWLGLPVASAATTWTQLATALTPYELVAAGDFLLRGVDTLAKYGYRPAYTPLVTLEELEAATRWCRRRGAEKLREALGRVRDKVESPKETELRLTLIDGGLPEPEINREIRSDSGEFLGRVDLSYPEYKVVVEFDGEQHRQDRYQFDRDIDRIHKLEENGWRVIRIRAALLRSDPMEVVRRVRVALIARGWVS
jgi:very-short-patch-repair endonuclease